MIRMNKCRKLFPESEMISRKLTSQIEFEKAIMPHASEFQEIVYDSFRDLIEFSKKHPIAIREPKQKEENLRSFIVERLVKKYPELIIRDSYGYSEICVCGYRLRINKLGVKSYMPYRGETKRSKQFREQKTTSPEDLDPVIFFGYTVDRSWSGIVDVAAVYLLNGNRQWVSSMEDICTKLENEVMINGIQPLVEPRVTLKEKKSKTV